MLCISYNRCIPYRWRREKVGPNGDTEDIIQVLMISSPKRDDLVFPKVLSYCLRIYPSFFSMQCNTSFHITKLLYSLCQGGWEDDETVLEAACREVLEEAGVKGILRVGSSP